MTRRTRLLSGLAGFVVLAGLVTGCTATLDGSGTARNVPGLGASGSTSGGAGSSSSSSLPPAPTAPAANFFDCKQALNLSSLHFPKGRLAQLTFSCALVKVPLNYADPDGTQIQLALLRVHDTRDTHPSQLLMNPGGPGASGIDLAAGLAPKMPQTVLDHYDLVGFDPRGVANSQPSLTCTSNSEKDVLNAASPDVLTSSGFAQASKLSAQTDRACTAKYGSSLQYYNTVDTARDMDQIREAVGDSKMNYLGFSYGTELGSIYAHLFPDKVRMMVLDGAVDPLTGELASDRDQLSGFESAFGQFGVYCNGVTACHALGRPVQTVLSIQAAARRAPIAVPNTTRRLTENLATTGVLSALYSRSDWPKLAAAMVQAKHGNGAGLLALADQYNERYSNGAYSNLSDANLVINCNDTAASEQPSDATIRSTAKTWANQYPLFGEYFADGLFSCSAWQPHRTPVPLPKAATPNKVLVLGEVHDPATPYKGAADLAKAMGNAQVLGWDGEGHTSYLEGSSCVDGYVDAYLVSGTLPPSGKVCPK